MPSLRKIGLRNNIFRRLRDRGDTGEGMKDLFGHDKVERRMPAEVWPVGYFVREELKAHRWSIRQLKRMISLDSPAVNDLVIELLLMKSPPEECESEKM